MSRWKVVCGRDSFDVEQKPRGKGEAQVVDNECK